MSSPLFSVVIPAYNAERFIGLTIKSILQQTVQDFEIVVVNDGSTDGTLQILESIQDGRLRIITQENGGECAARNRGLREAKGEYISFIDSDDAWLPNHLETALDFFNAHPEYCWFASTHKQVGNIAESDFQSPVLENGSVFATNWYLEGYLYILPSDTTVRRREAQDFPDLFQLGFKMFGDSLGWCKFAKKHPMIGISTRKTVLYRFWQGNACTTHNVYHGGIPSPAVKMALAKHVDFYSEPDCPLEARLYYRQFALGHWWAGITSALLPVEWKQDLLSRKMLLGSLSTKWLSLCSSITTLVMHAMRWGIRRRKLCIIKTMQGLANRTRINL